jgi:hypothetical protein
MLKGCGNQVYTENCELLAKVNKMEIFIAIAIQVVVLWVVMLCGDVVGYHNFR